MNVFMNTPKIPLFYTSFVWYLFDSNNIRRVPNAMLEGPKVFHSYVVKLMIYYKDQEGWFYQDVHEKSYDDKFVPNEDALEGYVPGRPSSASISSTHHATTASHALPPAVKVYLDIYVNQIQTLVQIREEHLMARLDAKMAEARTMEDQMVTR